MNVLRSGMFECAAAVASLHPTLGTLLHVSAYSSMDS